MKEQAKVMDVKRQLTHLKINVGDGMNDHIAKLKKLRNQNAMMKVERRLQNYPHHNKL